MILIFKGKCFCYFICFVFVCLFVCFCLVFVIGLSMCSRSLTGKTFQLEVFTSDSIGDVKLKIQEKTGILVNQKRPLSYGGERLDNDRTVLSYNILKKSTVQLDSSIVINVTDLKGKLSYWRPYRQAHLDMYPYMPGVGNFLGWDVQALKRIHTRRVHMEANFLTN